MPEQAPAGAVARVDGRAARAQRTRGAIVDAHLSLLRDGDLRPTGERIADRAGVSLRTLWTNFKDMETLFAASGERLFEMQMMMYEPIPVDLPLARRVDAYCAQRATMLEILAPAARASVIREPFSPQLQRNRTIEINRVRDQVTELFAPEIAAAGPGGADLVHALMMCSTFASWSELRDHEGLDVDGARGVVTRAVMALLRCAGQQVPCNA